MVVVPCSDAYSEWLEDVVWSLRNALCDAQPELCEDGTLYALYTAYNDLIFSGSSLDFDAVLQRGTSGGASLTHTVDDLHGPSPQQAREAVAGYARFTSQAVADRMLELTQGDSTLQLQALELHRALALPPESEAHLRNMLPSGQRLRSLAELESFIRKGGFSSDIPF